MTTLSKPVLAAALCAVLAASASAQGRESRGGGGESRSSARPQASRPQVSRPRAPEAPRLSPRAPARPSGGMPPATHYDLHPAPSRGQNQVRPGGAGVAPQRNVGRIDARGWGAPDHRSIVDAKGFDGRVFAHERDERQVNHVYWHTDGGQRYAHFYDGKNHWYGFYNGPRFYWTRYEDNRWWWFDQTASRWLYWHGGYWWWNDPANPAQIDVVVNNDYYPYAEVAAEPGLAPGAAPDDSSSAMAAVDSSGKGVHGNFSKVSRDGTREVQVYGDRREAFLYDRTGGGDPRFIAFLASGVKRVQFSEGAGIDLHVMLLMLDGSYETFDSDGRSLQPTTGNGAPAQPGVPGTDAVPADSSTGDAPPPSQPPSTDGASQNAAPPSGPPPIPAQ
jgi:hypothetical protein